MLLQTCLLLYLTSNAGLGCEIGSVWDFESGPLFGQTMLIFLFCCWASEVGDETSGSLTSQTEEEVGTQSTFSLCIESVPVWLLSQFPPLLNIVPETAVVAVGWVYPRLVFFFVFLEWNWSTALEGSPKSHCSLLHVGAGILETRGHFYSTCFETSSCVVLPLKEVLCVSDPASGT